MLLYKSGVVVVGFFFFFFFFLLLLDTLITRLAFKFYEHRADLRLVDITIEPYNLTIFWPDDRTNLFESDLVDLFLIKKFIFL